MNVGTALCCDNDAPSVSLRLDEDSRFLLALGTADG